MFTTGWNSFRALRKLIESQSKDVRWAWDERNQLWLMYESYYHNTVYDPQRDGGLREIINRELGEGENDDLAGSYNPIKRAVDMYQYVFDGAFGDEIQIDPRFDPARVTNSRLIEPIKKIWAWSNMTTQTELLCRMAANLGTVGIRIVAQNAADPRSRRVYLDFEHPGRIKDVDTDRRGNVTAIMLEYTRLEGPLGTERTPVVIRELLTKEYFQAWRDDQSWDLTAITPGQSIGYGSAVAKDTKIPNVLGVVPYVLLTHAAGSGAWGLNCYPDIPNRLDRINSLSAHTDTQIYHHVKAQWAIIAGGAPPERFEFDDQTVIYIRSTGDQPEPKIQAMVAPLSLADALAKLEHSYAEIKEALPELKATDGEFISGQSGETIAQLRLPAEQALFRARANYEAALIKAQKIALSWGILFDLWDLGTGTGTRESADRAYQDGFEDHKFNKRPGLPKTAAERLNESMIAQQERALAQDEQVESMAQSDKDDQEAEQ